MAKAKKKATKKKTGRPSKFNEDKLQFAVFMASLGYTDKQIAEKLKVTEQTVNNWKKAHPQFFESLKAEKEKKDNEVEKSLLERAMGYQHEDEKVFFDSKTGEVVVHKTTKHYPPDATSMIFWLKNRQPKKWRDKVEQQDDEIDEMEFE